MSLSTVKPFYLLPQGRSQRWQLPLATRTAAFSASLWMATTFLSLSPRPRMMAAIS